MSGRGVVASAVACLALVLAMPALGAALTMAGAKRTALRFAERSVSSVRLDVNARLGGCSRRSAVTVDCVALFDFPMLDSTCTRMVRVTKTQVVRARFRGELDCG